VRRLASLLCAVLLGVACGGGAPSSPAGGSGEVDALPRGPRLAQRLLIFAVDGATWKIADPLIEAGKMPHLARLVAGGTRASLDTLEPTLSPAIWTTIATGVPPERHGILGFDGVPGQSMTTLPNSRMRRVKAYWDVLPDAGLTSGTVGWWATWPVDDLGPGSFMVSDRVPYTRMEAAIARDELDAEDVWPREILAEILPLVERPDAIDPEVVRRFLKLEGAQMERLVLGAEYRMGSFLPEFKYVYQSDRSTMKIALHLLEAWPVDVAAVYVTGVDTVSHLFWHFTFPAGFEDYDVPAVAYAHFRDVIPLYYQLIDDYLGQLLAAVGPQATVMVVSDHGFGPTGHLPWSGGHGRITPGAPIAPPGMLVLSGPAIAPGITLERAHVLDLVPTLLHLLGLPAAADMPGRILRRALVPGSPPPLPRIPSYEDVGRPRRSGDVPIDEEGDAERRQRLKALGYLD